MRLSPEISIACEASLPDLDCGQGAEQVLNPPKGGLRLTPVKRRKLTSLLLGPNLERAIKKANGNFFKC